MSLPTEIVAFLFTDIEGSTRLLSEHRDVFAEALALHRASITEDVEGEGGTVLLTEGDARFAVLPARHLRWMLPCRSSGDSEWQTGRAPSRSRCVPACTPARARVKSVAADGYEQWYREGREPVLAEAFEMVFAQHTVEST